MSRAFLAIGISGLLGFLTVLADVAIGGPLSNADPGLSESLVVRSEGVTRGFWIGVTIVGEWHVTLATVALALLLLARRGRRFEALTVAATVAVSEVVVLVSKLAFARGRPLGGIVEASGFSFPSGHAARAALVVVLAGWLVVRDRATAAAAMAAGASWIVLVAASRVLLGVHWPTDVAAGAALGAAIGGFGVWIGARLRASARPRPPARDPA